jgi:hypothetical protein
VENWQFVLDEEVFKSFAAARADDRRKLLAVFDELSRDPNRKPDYYTKDSTNRTVNVWAAQPFLVTYWLDAYVQEIRIINVQKIRF